MAPVALDFGALDLTSTASGLKLHLSSNAQFATSGEDAECPSSKLTTDQLTSNSPDRPWITKGSEFCLIVSLHFDGIGDERECHHLLETAVQTLSTAELWGQFYLRPTSTRLEVRDQSATGKIFICLAHRDDETNESPRQQHKLAQGVPFYDVKPPPEIHIVHLDAVQLDMRLSREPLVQRGRLAQSLDESGKLIKPAWDLQQDAEASSLDVATPKAQQERVACYRRSHTTPDLSTAFELKATPSSHDSNGGEHLRCDVPQTCPPKRSCSEGHLYTPSRLQVSRQDFLEILDAAFRISISPSPKHVSKAISVDESHSFKHLANVIPAVWSPRYLTAMSSRSVLLPTVSHGLAKMCGEHSKSSRLRAKMIELERRNAMRSHNLQRSINFTQGNASIAPTNSGLLWSTMQTSLVDDGTANTLRPLPTCADVVYEDFEVLDLPCEDSPPAGTDWDMYSDTDPSILDVEDKVEDTHFESPSAMPCHTTPGLLTKATDEYYVDTPDYDDEMLSLCESFESLGEANKVAHTAEPLEIDGATKLREHAWDSDEEMLAI